MACLYPKWGPVRLRADVGLPSGRGVRGAARMEWSGKVQVVRLRIRRRDGYERE